MERIKNFTDKGPARESLTRMHSRFSAEIDAMMKSPMATSVRKGARISAMKISDDKDRSGDRREYWEYMDRAGDKLAFHYDFNY